MVVRIAACVMIIAGASGLSFEQAERMGKRKQWYEQLIDFIRMLLLEIRYGNAEIIECLNRKILSNNDFFSYLSELIISLLKKNDGSPFAEIWKSSIDNMDKYLKAYGCKAEDIELLMRLGNLLGECSQQRQTEQLEAFLEMIQTKKNIIFEGLAQRQKAVRFLGICTGMFIVLVLI